MWFISALLCFLYSYKDGISVFYLRLFVACYFLISIVKCLPEIFYNILEFLAAALSISIASIIYSSNKKIENNPFNSSMCS